MNMQEKITQLHLDILELCFKVRKKGHDAFYEYSAHVDWSTVRIYFNGWKVDSKKCDKEFSLLWSCDKDCDDDVSIKIVLDCLNDCKKFLEDLIQA